jgi:hypothetical protein
MKPYATPIIFALSLAACSAAPEADEEASASGAVEAPASTSSEGQSAAGREAFICGGETTREHAAQFFADLDSALKSSDSGEQFKALLTLQFTVIEGDTAASHDISRAGAVTPSLVTRDDWEAINARGLSELESVGYRGCMMDHGKVWFEASEGGPLKLKSINRDMDWVGPAPAG